MVKKILLIAASLALLGGLVAALVIFQPWGLIGWDKTPGMGNTNGNLQSGWPAVQGGEWVYFVDSTLSRSITKMTMDGQQRQTLEVGENSGIQALNLVGEWLYCTTGKGISKTRIDGAGFEKICSDSAYSLHVVDGWCYYLNNDDELCIYRIRINGTGRQKLSEVGADFLNVSDDGWIYYVSSKKTGDCRMYRMQTDGSDHTQISQEQCGPTQLDGEWLYYLSREEDTNDRLYRMRTDGTEITELLDYNFYSFLVEDGWVYYTLREEDFWNGDFKLHKARLDGTGHQVVSEAPFGYFSLIGDWVYGHTDPDKVFLMTSACRVQKDGTGWENLVMK